MTEKEPKAEDLSTMKKAAVMGAGALAGAIGGASVMGIWLHIHNRVANGPVETDEYIDENLSDNS